MSALLFGYACVHLRARRDRGVHSSSLGFTLARFRVAEFIRIRLRFPRTHLGFSGIISFRLVSLGPGYVSSVLIKFVWVHTCAQICRRVHAGSRGLTMARIFLIRVLVGFLEPMGSTDLFAFASVHSCACSDRGVHSGPRGFSWPRKAVASLIQVCVGSFVRAYASTCSFGFPGLTRARIDVIDGFILVRDGSVLREGVSEFIWVREGSRGCI